MAMPNVVCNEPLVSQVTARAPKTWAAMLAPDLPGKRVLVEIQLNHGIGEDEKPLLDTRLLQLYTALTARFGQLHGDATRCFLVRAPESLDLVGLHVQEFGGATNGIACLETVFCVSPRNDSKVSLAHLDERFKPAEFELHDGLPKTRIIDWAAHASPARAAEWSAVVKGALQYYVNRHKGPTGQIEVPLKGLNIVAASVLPEGLSTHSDTSLAAAALISIMSVAGEWGRVPLTEFCSWLAEAELTGGGRKSNIGTVLFGMPGEVVHVGWNPPRPKGHKLTEGHAILTAHTGLPMTHAIEHGRMRATTTHVAFAYLHQAQTEALARGNPIDVLTSDDRVYELLRKVPQRVTRGQVMEQIKSGPVREKLTALFKSHPEPQGGYAAREKLLFVLAEMQRGERAKGAIRKGDAAEIGALMNAGQVGEAALWQQLSAGGIVEAIHPILHASSDEELLSMADHADSLWRQSGCSGASTPETDLLCDLAGGINGVLGARWMYPQRISVVCKKEVLSLVRDRLTAGYYLPRGLSPSLLMQVYPCRGAGLIGI